jgi:hypothetical protein
MSGSNLCPKCRREAQPGEAACPRCGLRADRWSGFAAAAPGHPLVDRLWARLLESWEDEAQHARFLDEATAAGALDIAAARYSLRLRDQPDDARARSGLERATQLALQLRAPLSDPDEVLGSGARLLKLAGIGVAALLLLATMWVLMLTLSRR